MSNQLTPEEVATIQKVAEILTRGRTDAIRDVLKAMLLDVAHNASAYDSYGYWANSLRGCGRSFITMADYADGARKAVRST